MTDPGLKPCPACGATDVFVGKQGGVFFSACTYCNMQGPETLRRKGAIDEWNALPRRADIERVERERDWLAENMPNDICPAGRAECAYRCPTAGGKACYECLLCWLEAARQATTER